MKTKTLPGVLLIWLLLASPPMVAENRQDPIRAYIHQHFADQLVVTREQIEQLSWVLANPVVTPELSAQRLPASIHQEVPRALSRLYCLQLLRNGSNAAYKAFVAPQTDPGGLSESSFQQLAREIARLDAVSYEVLQATAILDAVTLSAQARKRAAKALGKPVPEDSTNFLSVSAPCAGEIYPLARSIISKHPQAARLFEIVYLPHSHLRHMMYNEGSLSMYTVLDTGIQNKSISRDDLNLWYDHWVVNIAGFRGHAEPAGSVYLTQNTWRSMNQLKLLLDRLFSEPKLNPMQVYLQKRGRWLHLNTLTRNPDEFIALASLGATARLFTPAEGRELYTSFKSLPENQQKQWIHHSRRQLTALATPSPTYGPAVYANAIAVAGLAQTVRRVLPVMLGVYQQAEQMRAAGQLAADVPLSFRELAREPMLGDILASHRQFTTAIDPDDGVAKLVTMDKP
ncbi:hypothetical protein [Endozoicomonas sp. ONNA2]|uniref:hypothetical protein n=1 Tax=Endozoicomonas sp. ONNA2 TaxID=2828741 RepID=UPI002148DC53|nr:hypothetical protein [Endozoicomonas sp. ONNA2]